MRMRHFVRQHWQWIGLWAWCVGLYVIILMAPNRPPPAPAAPPPPVAGVQALVPCPDVTPEPTPAKRRHWPPELVYRPAAPTAMPIYRKAPSAPSSFNVVAPVPDCAGLTGHNFGPCPDHRGRGPVSD